MLFLRKRRKVKKPMTRGPGFEVIEPRVLMSADTVAVKPAAPQHIEWVSLNFDKISLPVTLTGGGNEKWL